MRSSLIYAAMYFCGAYSCPISFIGRCVASAGKLSISPIACRVALLRSLFSVLSCMSVNIPRWVAWYLEVWYS